MSSQAEPPSPDASSAGWGRPQPERIPPPTYFPMVVAAGIVFAAFGLVFSWIFVVAGVAVFFVGLVGWINAIRRGASD